MFKIKNSRQGFTLLELLVVVLVIGILAAIALPQYRMAVIKTKVSTVLPLMSSVIQAEEVSYMTNGNYTNDLTSLDIEIPGVCSYINNTVDFKCGNIFFISWSNASVMASYCPNYNNDFNSCKSHRHFQIGRGSANQPTRGYWTRPGKFRCFVFSTEGEKVCKSLGHRIIDERYNNQPLSNSKLYEFD